MARFEFGIGITVDGAQQASQAIGSVISELESSMSSLSRADLSKAFKGTKKELEEVSGRMCGITTCVEEVDSKLYEVAQSTGGWRKELEKVAGVGKTVAEQHGRVKKAANLLTESASELEHVSVRTEASLGKGSRAAQDFGTQALTTAKNNMVHWKSVARLQVALRQVSVGFDSSSKAGKKQLDTMVKLSASFGMTEAEVSDLAGTAKATGNSLTELTGDAIYFQKKFQVPDLLRQLPVAAKGAMQAQGQFGTLVGKSSRDITSNVLRMAGTYSRALGVTAPEAARKALTTFQAFTSEVESYEDLFLGLADDFSPLQKAFLETGMGLDDLQDLMRKGQEDPAAYAEEVRRIRDSLDPQMGQRFFRQILRQSDEATRALLTQEEAAKNAHIANAGVGADKPADPSAVFNKIADAMRRNAGDAVAMHESLKGVASELVKFSAADGVRAGVMNVNKVLQAGNTVLLAQWEQLRNNRKAYEAYSKTIEISTTALVGVNDTLDLFNKVTSVGGTLLAGLGAAALLILRPFKFLGNAIGSLVTKFGRFAGWVRGAGLARGLGRIVGVIGRFAGPIGLAIGGISGLIEAFGRMKAVLSDPTKTGFEQFKGVTGGIFAGLAAGVDTFLLGIPSKIAKYFGLKGKFSDAFNEAGVMLGELGGKIGDWFSSFGKSANKFFVAFGQNFATYFRELWARVKQDVKSVGKAMLKVLGPVGTFLESTFGKAAAAIKSTLESISKSYKEFVAFFDMGEEKERIKKLEEEKIARKTASVGSAAIQRRISGQDPSVVDTKIEELLRAHYLNGGDQRLDVVKAASRKERRALPDSLILAQDKAINKSAARNFEGLGPALTKVVALRKLLHLDLNLEKLSLSEALDAVRRTREKAKIATKVKGPSTSKAVDIPAKATSAIAPPTPPSTTAPPSLILPKIEIPAFFSKTVTPAKVSQRAQPGGAAGPVAAATTAAVAQTIKSMLEITINANDKIGTAIAESLDFKFSQSGQGMGGE